MLSFYCKVGKRPICAKPKKKLTFGRFLLMEIIETESKKEYRKIVFFIRN